MYFTMNKISAGDLWFIPIIFNKHCYRMQQRRDAVYQKSIIYQKKNLAIVVYLENFFFQLRFIPNIYVQKQLLVNC